MKPVKWMMSNAGVLFACAALGAFLVMEVRGSRNRIIVPDGPDEVVVAKASPKPAKVRPAALRSYFEPIPPVQEPAPQRAIYRKPSVKKDDVPEDKPEAEDLSQVQQLLGSGFFPGAQLDPASVQMDDAGNPVWPSIVLDLPGQRLDDVLDYYGQVFPDAGEFGENRETVILRPGDDRRMHLEITEDDGQTRIVFREP